jgi:hypothetical protein
VPRPKPTTGGWEDVNRRVTFYCPEEVLDAIEAEMATSGRSKTAVIVDALRAYGLAKTDENHRELSRRQRRVTPPAYREKRSAGGRP